MNVAETYLVDTWERLAPADQQLPSRLVWLALTPRFRASAHVVLVGVTERRALPVLIAKLARLPGRSATLAHEAEALRAVHAARDTAFASAPHVVAETVLGGAHLLVETALRGRPMTARAVVRAPRRCAEMVLRWLLALHQRTACPRTATDDDTARLVGDPLQRLRRALPAAYALDECAEATRRIVARLAGMQLPLSMAHGDLAAPNILLVPGGRLGVVDWELAERESLPAYDLFFALAWLAMARARARDTEACVAAVHDAFFTPDGWVRPYVAHYAAILALPPAALAPLFVACWSRHVAVRAARLLDDGAPSDDETAHWLHRDRYTALWRHSVRHVDDFCPPR